MGGGYHGGFGHTHGAQVQEMRQVITRPITLIDDEITFTMPMSGTVAGHKDFEKAKDLLMISLVVLGETYSPVKFWYGYMIDILRNPDDNASVWRGFTRDFYLKKGAFSKNVHTSVIDPAEYLKDISQYVNKNFQYDNSLTVLREIQALLYFACDMRKAVRITVIT